MKASTFFLMVVTFWSCTSQQHVTSPSISVQGKRYAAFYQQYAAEYRALCYQAFNIARQRVDEWRPGTRPAAIITDIDETILDNSPYAVKQTALGIDHTNEAWETWTALGQADTMPGALSFLQYAASKGITIFYITNRNEIERAGTLHNLKRFNFPNAENEYLLLKDPRNKQLRRENVMETHDVLLLMGDNLSDFSALFDKGTTGTRKAAVDSMAAMFGNKWIVLPNQSYGDWEWALFNHNYNLTIPQRDSIIQSVLKDY